MAFYLLGTSTLCNPRKPAITLMGIPSKPTARRYILFSTLVCCAASSMWPLIALADALPAALIGNAAHGAQLVGACNSCHGKGGEGVANIAFPRLAGQFGPYLAAQMHDFAAGARHRAIMKFAVKDMSEQDLADVGAYYAAMNTPPMPSTAASDAAKDQRALQLVNQGDATNGIAACGSCHGPDSLGRAPDVPYIAGQHASYISDQINSWQIGDRHSDRGLAMAAVAKKLGAYDTDALASWLSRQAPPAPK